MNLRPWRLKTLSYVIPFLLMLAVSPGYAQVSPDPDFEKVAFNSENRTLEISAYLSRPDGAGPFPAVILQHGCTGLERDGGGTVWRGLKSHAAFLNASGFVALIVDSHGSRGISMSEAWSASCRKGIGFRERTNDLYGALKFLDGLPYIDSSRIAVVGFSQGGSVIFNSMDPSVGYGRTLLVKAGVAFYPDCDYAGVPIAFYGPILILIGDADDITPAEDCERLTGYASDKPGLVKPEIHIYPNVHHSFDLPLERPYATPIGTVAPNDGALTDARRRMIAFLRDKLGLD